MTYATDWNAAFRRQRCHGMNPICRPKAAFLTNWSPIDYFPRLQSGSRQAKLTLMKLYFAMLTCLLWLAAIPGIVRAEDKTNAAPAKVVHVDGKEAAKLVAKGDVTVVDIRTPSEYTSGHIAGATNINFRAPDFAEQLSKLDRDKPYLVHCAVGGRSTSSLPQFEKLGFKHVIHLDGGIKAWQSAGNPVEKK